MVFLTVGNANQRFQRLLDAVEVLTSKGGFDGERVLIQTGHNSDFKSRYCEYKSFFPMDEFQQMIEKADIVICHGGCTQLQAIRSGKIPIVMPRRKKYGEHVNDHQVQLTQALAAEGRVIPAYEPEDLLGAVAEAKRRSRERMAPPQSQMLELIERAIKELV